MCVYGRRSSQNLFKCLMSFEEETPRARERKNKMIAWQERHKDTRKKDLCMRGIVVVVCGGTQEFLRSGSTLTTVRKGKRKGCLSCSSPKAAKKCQGVTFRWMKEEEEEPEMVVVVVESSRRAI